MGILLGAQRFSLFASLLHLLRTIIDMHNKELQMETACSSDTKIHRKRITRKPLDVSPAKSDRSNLSSESLRGMKLANTLHVNKVYTQNNLAYKQQPHTGQNRQPITRLGAASLQKLKLSVCTYQSKFLLNQPPEQSVDSRLNSQPNLPMPNQTNFIFSKDQESSTSHKIHLLTRQLQAKTKQCNIIEVEKMKLTKTNSELIKSLSVLDQQNKTLAQSNDSLRRHLESEQGLVRKLSGLNSVEMKEIYNIQSQREQYLQKQIQKLKSYIQGGRSTNETMLQAQLASSRSELYNAKKTMEIMNVSLNCLQIKLKEKGQKTKYAQDQDMIRLRTLNKRIRIELEQLKQAHGTLNQEYNKLVEADIGQNHSFNLEYSTLT